MGLCGWSFCPNFSAVFSSGSTEMPKVTGIKMYKIYPGPPSAKLDGSQGANFCNPRNKGFCTPPIGGCWYKKKDGYFMLFHSFSM